MLLGMESFQAYRIWRDFLETELIYALQQGALEALNSIKEEYKSDSKFTDIMNEMMDDYDKTYAQCKERNNRIKYIGDNLNVIFYKDILVNDLTRVVNAEILTRKKFILKLWTLVLEFF